MAADIDLDAIAGTDGPSHHDTSRSTPFGILVDGLNAVGSLVIALMMVMICADVISRGVFQKPIAGVSELTAMAIVVIVFLSLASTLRHGRMSRADLFIDGFIMRQPGAGRILDAAFLLAGAAVCAIIAWATWPALLRAWERNDFVGTEGVFTVPTWPLRFAVIAGTVIAGMQYLVLVVDRIREVRALRRPAPVETPPSTKRHAA
jgi:TRAP-type C4-dicarboxylate transport system permease small subunit